MIRSSKYLAMFAAALLIAGCETFQAAPPSADQIEQDATTLSNGDNVVVLLGTQQAANRLVVNAARRGYQLQERTDLEGLDLILLDFQRPTGVSGDVAIGDMLRMEPSASAGLDHRYTLESGQSVSLTAPRLYADTMVAWPKTGCEARTAIGMIDGTVNTNIPTLSSVEIITQSFTQGEDAAVQHGTAIAELLVGPGRLDGARLYSASVVTENAGRGEGASVPALIRALDWMQTSGVSVTNISLAGPYNTLLDRAIQRATQKGMIIIAAVGNDGPDAAPRYPAAFKDVIAVTAVDSAQEIYTRAVRGDHVDFSAPGVDVYIDNGGERQYLSGTSVAAPFVTALVASDPDLANSKRPRDVRNGLEKNVVDLGSEGRDPIFGTGLIQLARDCKKPQ